MIDARRLGLRPDRVCIRTVGTESQPTCKRCSDAGPQLQKVLDFRKSLEESRQVLSHGFANEAEFKAEVDRHLRAFAKGELPPANAPRDKVLLPLAVLAEVQKEKAEKEQALARAEREHQLVEAAVQRRSPSRTSKAKLGVRGGGAQL